MEKLEEARKNQPADSELTNFLRNWSSDKETIKTQTDEFEAYENKVVDKNMQNYNLIT